ncbi:restriction endonuclease subunit S [Chryseobacterium taichungense]|uniref:restriction endonuclease subunit S n=1 Tax=Chryseobacterium taichungense TaxID=295069 RepID=UPI0035E449A4
MENPEGKFPAEFDTYQEVKKGDFVFCLFDVEETPRTVGLADFDGMITGAYTVFNVSEKANKKFLYYFYLNLDEKKRLKFLYRGLRNTIPKDSFFTFKTAFPPIEEQQTIATFLDDKTAKIDQTIAIKQKEIELLKERRQILIQKAVTKGLDDTVKLKDSGVDWIGKIPEHWEVRKLVSVCRFVRGNSPFGKDELLNAGEYIALQYGKTYKVNEVNEEYSFYVNNEFYKNSQVVKYGDVILVSTSETIEDLGHTVYYRRNEIGLLGGEQIMLKPNQEQVDSHFLYFSAKAFSKELQKFATGIKVFRFNINDLKTIYNALPPLFEQKEIANFIEINSNKIAKAIMLKEQEIEKLKEYKTVLIDQVVTGKVRVSKIN